VKTLAIVAFFYATLFSAGLPSTLRGYHFDQHIRVFTLGDADTPPFRLYQTDGLRPGKSCVVRI